MLNVSRNKLAQALRVAAEQYLRDATETGAVSADPENGWNRIKEQFERQAKEVIEIAEAVEDGQNLRLQE